MERSFRITVDGQVFMVTVEELDGTPQTALPSSAVVSAPAAPTASPPAQGAVVSHLGGTVDEISVKVGQHVAAGDRLATIEAMKMKNAIFASSAGTVKSIEVAAGDTVSAGQVLLRLG